VSLYARARLCRSHAEIAEACEALLNIPEKHYPIRIEVKRENRKRKESKNRLLNVHMRDIARWRYNMGTVPDRLFEKVVDDTKNLQVDGKHIWPRYSDPEPDTYTGETTYGPVSRADLTDKQIEGIMDWLVLFIAENHIPVKPMEQGEPT